MRRPKKKGYLGGCDGLYLVAEAHLCITVYTDRLTTVKLDMHCPRKLPVTA